MSLPNGTLTEGLLQHHRLHGSQGRFGASGDAPDFGDGSNPKNNSNFGADFLEGETLQIEDRPHGVDNASAFASASTLASASSFTLPLFVNPLGLNLVSLHSLQLHDSPRGGPAGPSNQSSPLRILPPSETLFGPEEGEARGALVMENPKFQAPLGKHARGTPSQESENSPKRMHVGSDHMEALSEDGQVGGTGA